MIDATATTMKKVLHSKMKGYRREAYVLNDAFPVDVVAGRRGYDSLIMTFFLVMHQNDMTKDVLVEVNSLEVETNVQKPLPPELIHQILDGTRWEKYLADSEDGSRVYFRGFREKLGSTPLLVTLSNTTGMRFLNKYGHALAAFLHYKDKMDATHFKMKTLADAKEVAACLKKVFAFKKVMAKCHQLCRKKSDIMWDIENSRDRIENLTKGKQDSCKTHQDSLETLRKYNLIDDKTMKESEEEKWQ